MTTPQAFRSTPMEFNFYNNFLNFFALGNWVPKAIKNNYNNNKNNKKNKNKENEWMNAINVTSMTCNILIKSRDKCAKWINVSRHSRIAWTTLLSSETWKQPNSTMTSRLMEECSVQAQPRLHGTAGPPMIAQRTNDEICCRHSVSLTRSNSQARYDGANTLINMICMTK